MTKYRKQHIVPKTYLRYFSKDNLGLGIVALNLSTQNNKPRYYNQGDSIFWKNDFYTDYRFEDNLTIEKFFGKVIEPTYNKLIKAINTRESLNTWEIKILFLQWIVYNKLRSPIFRNDLEVQIKLLYQNSGDLSAPDSIIVDKIVKRYAKQLHLNYFLNLNKLADYVNLMVAGLMVKEWKILIAPD